MNKEMFIRTVNLSLLRFFFFQLGKPATKKGKKTGKGIVIDLSEILIYYSSTAVVSSYTISLIRMIAVARWPMLVFDLPARNEENSGNP